MFQAGDTIRLTTEYCADEYEVPELRAGVPAETRGIVYGAVREVEDIDGEMTTTYIVMLPGQGYNSAIINLVGREMRLVARPKVISADDRFIFAMALAAEYRRISESMVRALVGV